MCVGGGGEGVKFNRGFEGVVGTRLVHCRIHMRITFPRVQVYTLANVITR